MHNKLKYDHIIVRKRHKKTTTTRPEHTQTADSGCVGQCGDLPKTAAAFAALRYLMSIDIYADNYQEPCNREVTL